MRPLSGPILGFLLIVAGTHHSSAAFGAEASAHGSKRRLTTDPVAALALPVHPASGMVRGRVVLPDGTGMMGLRVSVGEQRQLTGSEGSFELREVPASYDLTIAEHGGRFITAYFGLTRRDPILTHTARPGGGQIEAAQHADIEGIVDLSSLVGATHAAPPGVYFLSSAAFAKGSVVEYEKGRGRYRVSMGWAKSGPVSGVLVAVSAGDGKAYLAQRRLEIVDGKNIQLDLGGDKAGPEFRFKPVALGRIGVSTVTYVHDVEFVEGKGPMYSKPGGGWVTSRPGAENDRERVKVGYAVPGTVGLVDLGACELKDEAFVCQVPDLSVLGGEYCVSIVSIGSHQAPGPNPKVDLRANRCGAKLGTKGFHIDRGSQPELGLHGFSVGPDTTERYTKDRLSWSAAGEPLYQLSLGSCAKGGCLVAYLRKSVFTWADFETTGMTYLRGDYLPTRVSAFYPAITVDALAADPRRLEARATWQRADSRAVVIGLKDPPPSPPKGTNPQARKTVPLPSCPATMEVRSMADLDTGMDSTEISLRGRLVSQDTECVEHGCNAIWLLEPLGNTGPRIGLLEQMSPVPARDHSALGMDRGMSGIEVVATGTLVARAAKSQYDGHSRPYRYEYSLNDVLVCAVRPPAAR